MRWVSGERLLPAEPHDVSSVFGIHIMKREPSPITCRLASTHVWWYAHVHTYNALVLILKYF